MINSRIGKSDGFFGSVRYTRSGGILRIETSRYRNNGQREVQRDIREEMLKTFNRIIDANKQEVRISGELRSGKISCFRVLGGGE